MPATSKALTCTHGSTDVVVSDGFVGNVVLKVSEGVAEAITTFLKERIGKSFRGSWGTFFSQMSSRSLPGRSITLNMAELRWSALMVSP